MLLVRNGTYTERSRPGSHPRHRTVSLVLQQSYQRAAFYIKPPVSRIGCLGCCWFFLLLQKVLGRSGLKGLEIVWLQLPYYLQGFLVCFFVCFGFIFPFRWDKRGKPSLCPSIKLPVNDSVQAVIWWGEAEDVAVNLISRTLSLLETHGKPASGEGSEHPPKSVRKPGVQGRRCFAAAALSFLGSWAWGRVNSEAQQPPGQLNNQSTDFKRTEK